jgi:polar amino acid transport system permease protein
VLWDWNRFLTYLVHGDTLQAAYNTVLAAVAAQCIGVSLGLVLGAASTSHNSYVRRAVDGYVRLFRGTPLLLQILAFWIIPLDLGFLIPVVVAGVLALGTNEAAYLSEVVRSGLLSVDRGQHEAARNLGMSGRQVLLLVTLPQAARVMIPPLGNAFNAMLKTTALLTFISYPELMRHSVLILDTTYRPFEIFAVVSLYYLAMTTGWGAIQAVLERRFALPTTMRPRVARLRQAVEPGV